MRTLLTIGPKGGDAEDQAFKSVILGYNQRANACNGERLWRSILKEPAVIRS